MRKAAPNDYKTVGAMNHIGVVVEDLDAVEARVLDAGFQTTNHGDYEPGRRFYFHDQDEIEFEVVSYDCDLDLGQYIKNTIFDFGAHRRIEHYGLITEQTGIIPQPED